MGIYGEQPTTQEGNKGDLYVRSYAIIKYHESSMYIQEYIRKSHVGMGYIYIAPIIGQGWLWAWHMNEHEWTSMNMMFWRYPTNY